MTPTPTLSSVDRNSIPWQQKVPGVPVNAPDPGPMRQRYMPSQQHQPYELSSFLILKHHTTFTRRPPRLLLPEHRSPAILLRGILSLLVRLQMFTGNLFLRQLFFRFVISFFKI